ncbi:hypothetical protein TYRP_022057 [Tyrophagus putrescentiae]|nr:hypothetical protein TYRP_022057 [Tyrophagus putrescentiae]
MVGTKREAFFLIDSASKFLAQAKLTATTPSKQRKKSSIKKLKKQTPFSSQTFEQLNRNSIVGTGHTGDDNVGARKDVFHLQPRTVLHPVLVELQIVAAVKEEDIGNVHRVDLGAVVGQQGGQRSAHDLTSIDDGDRLVVQLITVGGVFVRRTGNDRLQVFSAVNVPYVVVHVETEEVTETFHIFKRVDAVLNVLVVAAAKDRVVDEDAVDGVVIVSGDDRLFQRLSIELSKFEGDARLGATAFSHLGVLLGAGVGVGEEGDELHLEVVLLYVRLQVFTDLMHETMARSARLVSTISGNT